jgi:hypothetical protein
MENKDVLLKKYKKFGTASIVAQLDKGKNSSTIEEVCLEILKSRGINVSKWEKQSQEISEIEIKKDKVNKLVSEDTTKEINVVQEKNDNKGVLEPSIQKGDKIKFTVAKNSKKAANQELEGIVKNIKGDSNKKWLIIFVEGLGFFLKESSKCKKVN